MTYSIIIPVYNDPYLPKCLESIKQAIHNFTVEVIIVENSNTVWVEPLVKKFGFTYLKEPITGSYQARNTGLTKATGDILAFTDSDCTVQPDWLEQIQATLENDNIAGVMGFSAGAPATRVAALEQLMYEANIAAFTNTAKLKRVDTRNLAIKRKVIERIGQFTSELKYGGDMEFGARAHLAGLSLVYNSNMIVTHNNAKFCRGLLLKRLRQNYGNMLITQLHNKQFIQTYFPHLLRYQAGFKNTLTYYWYKILFWPNYYLSDTIINLLPIKLGYTYFKFVNVLAMRIGQLTFVFRKNIW
ncbi:MAG: glycosyltransferase family A protein [Patescibacteria group bacterium]|jgi:glycosyltransferase involved in cell wall biosynthesis